MWLIHNLKIIINLGFENKKRKKLVKNYLNPIHLNRNLLLFVTLQECQNRGLLQVILLRFLLLDNAQCPKKMQKKSYKCPMKCNFFDIFKTHCIMWSSSWSTWLTTSIIGRLTTMARIAGSTKMQHWGITFDGMRWGFNCDHGWKK